MAVYDVRCAQKAVYDQPADIHPLLLSHSHSYSRCLTVTMSAGGIAVFSGSLLLSLAGRTNGFVQQVRKGEIFWIVFVFLAWGGVEELNLLFFGLVLYLNEGLIFMLCRFFMAVILVFIIFLSIVCMLLILKHLFVVKVF